MLSPYSKNNEVAYPRIGGAALPDHCEKSPHKASRIYQLVRRKLGVSCSYVHMEAIFDRMLTLKSYRYDRGLLRCGENLPGITR
jgi:hypothetical protein